MSSYTSQSSSSSAVDRSRSRKDDKKLSRSDKDRMKDKDRKDKKDKMKKKKKRRRESSEGRDEKKRMNEDLKKQKMALIEQEVSAQLGYSNVDNPFNDTNLTQRFVWKKKVDKQTKMGISAGMRESYERNRRDEVEGELEKLKKRREERQEDRMLRDAEDLRIQREKNFLLMGDYERKEAEFNLMQTKRRAQIRIKEGRALPIDPLVVNICYATDPDIAAELDADGIEMDFNEPYQVLDNLNLRDLNELKDTVETYMELERHEKAIKYWEVRIFSDNSNLIDFNLFRIPCRTFPLSQFTRLLCVNRIISRLQASRRKFYMISRNFCLQNGTLSF